MTGKGMSSLAGGFLVAWLVYALAMLVVFGGIVYAVCHFAAKFW